ncbi:unnamed protein product, partial [Prorocentrum cordatum]
MTLLQLARPRRPSDSSACSTESAASVSEHENLPTCECTPKLHGVGSIFDLLVHPSQSSRLEEERAVAQALGLDEDLRAFWRRHGACCRRGRAPEGQE